LGSGGVAHNIFFLKHIAKMRSVFEAVSYVLEYFVHNFRTVVIAE